MSIRALTISSLWHFLKDSCSRTRLGSHPTTATKDGIVMEKKVADDGSAIPMVRGRGIIEGVKPYHFLTIASHTGARQFWDPRFQAGYALKRFSRRAYKFYTIQK